MKMVDFKQMVYVADKTSTTRSTKSPEGKKTLDISGTELRDRLPAAPRSPTGSRTPAS